MNKDERKKVRKKITFLSIALLAAMVAFLVYIGMSQKASTMVFYIGVAAFLIIYWLLLDVVEPRLLHDLDDVSGEKKSAYIKFAGADLIGYAGIAYFIFNIGSGGSSGLFGALVYILCVSVKRKYRDEFYGTGQGRQPEEVKQDIPAVEEDGARENEVKGSERVSLEDKSAGR